MKFNLLQRPWHDMRWLEIDLPDNWDVQYCPMNGYDNAPLSIKEMTTAIEHPIGTAPLWEIARGKKRAVIVFDDMTRPTRAYELAPLVLKTLHEAGLSDDQITFVCALGTHGAYPDRTLLDWFANPEDGTIVRDWDAVMEMVRPNHGQGTRAAVLPNATMQYFA